MKTAGESIALPFSDAAVGKQTGISGIAVAIPLNCFLCYILPKGGIF